MEFFNNMMKLKVLAHEDKLIENILFQIDVDLNLYWFKIVKNCAK
jgi:hypothetical protein